MPDTPDEELVRRLLADARHDEPIPADVVARLDRVLGDLAAEEDGPADVTPLHRPPERRRRRWGIGLVAAAAVVTAIAIAPHATLTGENDGSSDSGAGRSASDKSSGARVESLTPAVLNSDTLAADVRAARRRLAAAPVPPHALDPGAADGLGDTCATTDRGAGTALPALLDGTDAILMLRPPAGGRQQADVLECGRGRVLASVTLPAP